MSRWAYCKWCSWHETYCRGCMMQRVRSTMRGTSWLLLAGVFVFAFFASTEKALALSTELVAWLAGP